MADDEDNVRIFRGQSDDYSDPDEVEDEEEMTWDTPTPLWAKILGYVLTFAASAIIISFTIWVLIKIWVSIYGMVG